MRIDFENMNRWPNRDASWYFSAQVFDNEGARYPVRIMTEGVALLAFNADVPEPREDIVLAVYRQELEELVTKTQSGSRLTPANESRTVNVVFLVNGNHSPQIQNGDIVIYNAEAKLEAMARKMGRL